MKVLLTHAYYLNEDPKEQAIMKPYVPLGILYLSAYLDQHKVDHEVYDSTFSRFDDHFTHIRNKQFDVVAIYTNLMTKLNVLKLIKVIKNDSALKHTRIILGGPEVRNHAEAFLTFGADVLIVGEGEETLLEVVQHFQTGNMEWPEIAGTVILRDGKVHQHQERALVKDINTLPFP
ncbi:MAG: cobalamin-dependent protein, partial [Bacteroidetes bacterium]|nr:cobalamin-dependent protein [Bacteroidota bacterium]